MDAHGHPWKSMDGAPGRSPSLRILSRIYVIFAAARSRYPGQYPLKRLEVPGQSLGVRSTSMYDYQRQRNAHRNQDNRNWKTPRIRNQPLWGVAAKNPPRNNGSPKDSHLRQGRHIGSALSRKNRIGYPNPSRQHHLQDHDAGQVPPEPCPVAGTCLVTGSKHLSTPIRCPGA